MPTKNLEINNERLKSLYMKENGKLLLDFPNERYNQYINIIKETKSYIDVLKSIPNTLSKIEKVYYVYNKLGIQLYENNSLVYNHINNLYMYYDIIGKNGVGNCRQMSELYVSMLLMSNLIENFYLVRKPVGVELLDLRHINAIIQVDGELIMTDIIRDTVNMRAGIRNSRFGFTDTMENRLREIKSYLITSNLLPFDIKNTIISLMNKGKYNEILNLLKEYEKKTKTDVGIFHLERIINKLTYVEELEKKFGNLTIIPQKLDGENISIELLDERINNIGKYDSVGFPFDLSINNYHYFEDVLDNELIPRIRMEDSNIRKKWCLCKNIVFGGSLDKNIEIDVDIILNFIYQIAPNIDSDICLKYLRMILLKIYSTREQFKDIVTKEWIESHIKIYKITENINLINSNIFPLQTFLVIKKETAEKEKYVFYLIEEKKEPRKISYDFVVNLAYMNQMKICSKFATERNDFAKKLQL